MTHIVGEVSLYYCIYIINVFPGGCEVSDWCINGHHGTGGGTPWLYGQLVISEKNKLQLITCPVMMGLQDKPLVAHFIHSIEIDFIAN